MKKLEEAIIYATIMHQGKTRKLGDSPYILHPLEVAQILSTLTDDEDVITAGILHDIVEDTDGTLPEIEKRFGARVAKLVSSETEFKYPDKDPKDTWQKRKEDSILMLKNSQDTGVKMLWLADKLANIRSLAGSYSAIGDKIWDTLNQKDPEKQHWYYKSIGEILELSLNKTGAFKEFIKQVNSIWPGTFDSEKSRYKKYREVSVDGCKLLGWGAKGEVYRYDDELVIKVYNHNNTYSDIEQEIAQSRKAFIRGIPTAISFGIVSVGDRYGSMFELLESSTISECIASNPGQVDKYAKIMAELAHTIHGIEIEEEGEFPPAIDRFQYYIDGGIDKEDIALSKKCTRLLGSISGGHTLVHGDFHTGNVFLQNGEPLLIDMDRLSVGHPMLEISDLYYFYVVLGEEDPKVVEDFMGFSYETAKMFFDYFLEYYLDTEDEKILQETKDKADVICCIRMINKRHKNQKLTKADREAIDRYIQRLSGLLDRIDTLA